VTRQIAATECAWGMPVEDFAATERRQAELKAIREGPKNRV
jgi:hypothetical protein